MSFFFILLRSQVFWKIFYTIETSLNWNFKSWKIIFKHTNTWQFNVKNVKIDPLSWVDISIYTYRHARFIIYLGNSKKNYALKLHKYYQNLWHNYNLCIKVGTYHSNLRCYLLQGFLLCGDLVCIYKWSVEILSYDHMANMVRYQWYF